MTYLTNLRKLAEAAQRSVEDDNDVYKDELDDLYYCLYPSVVLALLDVIEAAKAARMMNTDEAIAILDAALARLEQEG